MKNGITESSYTQADDEPASNTFFEQLEELQFASYEHGTKLRVLVETIQQSSLE